MNKIQKQLLDSAKDAATFSYSPYSKFRVGAAVLADGAIVTGTNVENASYPLGICAERVAIATALSKGLKNIEGIAIACIDANTDLTSERDISQLMPCGACRQWISELAPDAWIVVLGSEKVFKINDIFPHAFSLNTKQK